MSMTKIELMHSLFGTEQGFTCETCYHLRTYKASRTYYKCNCYGNTRSSATDWKKSNPACGLWNQTYVGSDVIEYKKHMSRSKQETQMEGQMRLFE